MLPVVRIFARSDGEPLPRMRMVELQGALNVPADLVPEREDDVARLLEAERQTKKKKSSTRTKEEGNEAATEPLISIGFMDADAHFPSRRTLRMGTLRVDGASGRYQHPILVLRRRGTDSTAEESDTTDSARADRERPGADPVPASPPGAPPAPERSSGDPAEEDVDAVYDRLVQTTAEPETELFSDWLARHPEMLELEPHFGGSARLQRKRQREAGEALMRGAGSVRHAAMAASPGGETDDGDGDVGVKDYDVVGVVEEYTIFNSKPSRVFR